MRRIILTGAILVAVLALAGAAYAGGAFSDAEFKAELSGDNEVPPVSTETSGEAKFKVHEDRIDFELEIDDADAALGAAGAHIHCAPEGENGPVVAFLAGQVPGGFDGGVELKAALTEANIVNGACGSSLEELVASMRDGRTYVNVHSPDNPAGEVRGQIHEG